MPFWKQQTGLPVFMKNKVCTEAAAKIGDKQMMISRRSLLKSASAVAGLAGLPVNMALAALAPEPFQLRTGFVEKELKAGAPKVGFWGFNDSIPGPVLRYRKGEKARILVSNGLSVDTAVHWHGVRVPNAMDGIPFVTQDAIKPGGQMLYEYPLRDSGTFWYHPHQSSFEQVPRGLYGAYIVEETKPIEVDRDVVWVLSDVKLGADGQQVEDFGRILDLANEGRIGNQVLINGRAAGEHQTLGVRQGERLRLRLINAASARIFRLTLAGHIMTAIAFDGQAVEPHEVEQVHLGPGMRIDLVVDCMQPAGSIFTLSDVGHRGVGQMVRLVYSGEAPLREKPMNAPVRLEPNALPEPDLQRAEDHYIMFQGGMRGAPVIGQVDGQLVKTAEMMETHGLAWTMNYTAQHEHSLMQEPLFRFKQGASIVLHLINETDFSHPMHLHGHFFRVIAKDGQRTRFREWRDTVLMGPRESVDIAFVADNPGEWMLHCHILDHAAGGMMGTMVVE
jgi:FtsP/CotA-like multicopper oxidase with cupredoxin domain